MRRAQAGNSRTESANAGCLLRGEEKEEAVPLLWIMFNGDGSVVSAGSGYQEVVNFGAGQMRVLETVINPVAEDRVIRKGCLQHAFI